MNPTNDVSNLPPRRSRRGLTTRRRFAAGLLACAVATGVVGGTTPPARAQTTHNRYAEDWARLQKVIGWATGTWDFINGARSVVSFLTGAPSGPQPVTLEEIRETVVGALQEAKANDLVGDVQGLLRTFSEIQLQSASQMHASMTPEAAMSSHFARTYLATRFGELHNASNVAFEKMNTILRGAASSQQNKLVVAVLPAYTMLVPMMVASLKMLSDISPELRAGNDAVIRDKGNAAYTSLFSAVGLWAVIARPHDGSSAFLSTVGADVSWMLKRPLYAYYNQQCSGCRIFVPWKKYWEYQALPLVDLALQSIQRLADQGLATPVDTARAYVWHRDTDPQVASSNPRFVDARTELLQARHSHFGADGTLFKEVSRPEVYVVYGAAKFHIPGSEWGPMGFRWEHVHVVPDGASAVFGAVPYDWTLLKERSRPEVFVVRSGLKVHIPDPATFERMGFRWHDVRILPDGGAAQVPTAPANFVRGVLTALSNLF